MRLLKPNSNKRFYGLVIFGLVLASVIAPALMSLRVYAQDPVYVPEWSSVHTPPYPVSGAPGVVNPVLRGSDVTDVSASFVADPFLFHEGTTWYMFFEVQKTVGVGDIGYATSTDGLHWTYQKIVLADGTHHAFPCLFKWNDEYYMVPASSNAVKLFKATSFPTDWSLVCTIVSGPNPIGYVDPDIFRYDGKWWLFTATQSDRSHLEVFYSDDLENPASWHAHPGNPVVVGTQWARPGGRVLVFDNGRIIRHAQKCDVSYGEKVRAFEIDTLTVDSYVEHEIPESPVLSASGSGWNANGMHNFDPWWIGDRWLAAVDGVSGSTWSIGIYISPAVPQAPVVSNPIPADGASGVSTSITALSFDLSDPQGNPMNYQVTTTPNIGSSSGTGVYNNRYYVSVGGLASDIDYTWHVSATDGTYTTDVDYHFNTKPMIPDWSNVPYDFFTLSPATTNPVLTAADVTDRTAVTYIADCFMFPENNVWYMFFEVYSSQGIDLGCASSNDGLHWTYQRIILDEPFTLAYPEVFKWNGEYYMVPESATNSIRLYRATNFPYDWEFVNTLVSGRIFVDPSTFRYNDKWWIFAPTSGSTPGVTHLYYSDTLENPASWHEHPQSPIIGGVSPDMSKARGGGRPTVFDGNRLIRLTQKCDVSYGEAVRAFEVDTLTETSYAEHEIVGSPILRASGSGWNKDGMHTADPWWIGDRWLVCADGVSNGIWSLGIYVSPQVTEAPVVSNPSPPDGITGVSPSLSQLSFDLADSQGDPMSYTVTTQPNIGGGSGTDVGNDKYSVGVSGLAYGTTYSWFIHASDGTHSTDVAYTFTTLFLEQTVVPDWSSVGSQPYPMSGALGAANPVMTAAMVGGGATYVFNPRIFHEGNTWYMFMAVQFAAGTKIGYATSSDGLTWTYQGVLLDYTSSEGKSISSPLVFKVDSEYYMLPSCQAWNELRLYKASSFPTGWTLDVTLKTGVFVDPCIMRYADTWWIFAATGTARDSCVLYYNEGNLEDPASWIAHPKSPIVSGDAGKARPAGRNIVFDNNKIIRWAMKNDVAYGEKVRAFRITTLTKTEYVEVEIAESPVLGPSGSGWNANGMHAVDPWWSGNRWLVAVDGVQGSIWSIGIYATSPIAASVESCDSGGVEKNTFNFRDTVYVSGTGFDISKTHIYPIRVVPNTEWSNGMDIPDRVLGTALTVTMDQYGRIQPTNVWPQALPGYYDIIVDVNGNGKYDAGIDVLDDVSVGGAGFFVVPEYALGTVLALGVCFAGFAAYRRSKRTRH